MILYVETNFVFELALLREEHEHCEAMLSLVEQQQIALVLPAFSVTEPYESLTRSAKYRTKLHLDVNTELKEIARSKTYQQPSTELIKLTNLIIDTIDEEKRTFNEMLKRLLDLVTIIPTDNQVLQRAIEFQTTRNLQPQDAVIYASIIEHLQTADAQTKCFVTKNSKDFVTPDIKMDLENLNCKLLTRFENAVGFVTSNLPKE